MPLSAPDEKRHVLSLGFVDKAFAMQFQDDIDEAGGRPQVLYHYTDMVAAQKILESGAIWASSPLLANDADEFKYMQRLVVETLDEVDPPVSGALRELVEEVCADLYRDASVYRVASFCADGDLLSQWRSYGRFPSIAYALGAGWDDLQRVTAWRDGSPVDKYEFALRKVVYDRDRQRSLVRIALDAFQTVAPGLLAGTLDVNTQKVDRQYVKELLIELIEPLLVVLKSPQFDEEREWRLVGHHVDAAGMSPVRPSAYGLAPYEAVGTPLEGSSKQPRYPLQRVWQGPTPFAESALHGMRHLLSREGYEHDLPVERSEASLR